MGRVEAAGKEMKEMSKGRKSLISRTLERCKSLGKAYRHDEQPPAGCLSVYIGPAWERFVVRTECLNHPLFRALLDEAEQEYGYAAQGPLALPCDVEAFLDVLWEMERELDQAAEMPTASPMCGLGKGRAAPGYRLLSPATTSVVGRKSAGLPGTSPISSPLGRR